MNIQSLSHELITMMKESKYPIEEPLSSLFIESLADNNSAKDVNILLKQIAHEAHLLLTNQPEYIDFLTVMDGFEYNALTLFSFSIPEPLVKNIFLINEFYRNNDDFIDPDLENRLVIGEDSISLFTYDTKTNLFEIRDNVATDSVYGSFDNFTEFFSEILGTVR